MSGKAGGLPRRPPLSTARAAFTASQRKQARRRLPDTSDIATASGVKTAPRSSLTTTTVPLSLKPRDNVGQVAREVQRHQQPSFLQALKPVMTACADQELQPGPVPLAPAAR